MVAHQSGSKGSSSDSRKGFRSFLQWTPCRGAFAVLVLAAACNSSQGAGGSDAGASDARSGEAGARDSGRSDAGASDSGAMDAGTMDAGTNDAGTVDAGGSDGGTDDSGTNDAGGTDADAGSDAGVTPVNTPPEILSVTITPAEPRPDDTLTCDAEVEDADGDDVTVAYRWTINGADAEMAGAVVDLDLSPGDEVTCLAEADDGTDTASMEVSVTTRSWLTVFVATTSSTGPEPWITDGTAEGTQLLADINENAPVGFDTEGCLQDGYADRECDYFETNCEYDDQANAYCGQDGGSSPSDFVALDDWVYFVAEDGTYGRELFRTDGVVVERLTDINPSGDSFDEDTHRLTNKPLQVSVHEGALYLRAKDSSGSYHVYRYTEADGPQKISDVDDVQNVTRGSWRTFASVGTTLYWAVERSTGEEDIYAYDGTGTPVAIGAGCDHITSLRSTAEGLIFRGYTSADGYRTYVFTASATSPAVHQTSVGSLGDGGILFHGEVCGVASGYLNCLDGTAPPGGLRQIGPQGLGSSGFYTVVSGSHLCFRAYVSGYAVYCTDGTAEASTLPGDPDGSHLAAHQGDLYFTCFDTDALCRWTPGGAEVSEADAPGGRPYYTTPLRGSPYLLYNAPPPGGGTRSLRIYDADAQTAVQVPEALEPHRFFSAGLP